jgi:transcriptional regulator with XRE-family HTH domain
MLANLRKRRGLSLTSLSARSGLPVGVLTDIERGDIPVCLGLARIVGPPLGRSPFSLLTENLHRLVEEEDKDGAGLALIEIAKASGQPDHLTPADKQELTLLEPVFAKLKNTAGESLSLASVREMFTPPPADNGFMPLLGRANSVDPDPTNSGFMPIRPIDA